MRAACHTQVHSAGAISGLEYRSLRLAQVVEAISRRRDVREIRARIVLMLLDLACPLGARPRRSWYVPGAAARVGHEGIRSRWFATWGEEPPTKRTIQRHLGELERAGVLVRAPGDWVPALVVPDQPGQRSRYRDTIHLLESDEVAEWWATVGARLRELHPDTRCNPTRWREVFGDWRARAAAGGDPWQPGLFDDPAEISKRGIGGTPPSVNFPVQGAESSAGAAPTEISDRRGAAERLAEVVHRRRLEAGELLVALDLVGARVRGGVRLQLQRDLGRLRGAAALLAVALRRGDRVRNPAGWVVRAWQRATPEELERALDRARQEPRPVTRDQAKRLAAEDRAVLDGVLGGRRARALRASFHLEP